MTKQDKRIALILGIIALILLLLARRAGSTVLGNDKTPDLEYEIPAFNLPPRPPYVVNIPGLSPSDFDFGHSVISGCLCGGSSVPYYQTINAPQSTVYIAPNPTLTQTEQYSSNIDYRSGEYTGGFNPLYGFVSRFG